MLPSLGQLRWVALLFAAFFAVSSGAQYLFVSKTSRAKSRADLANSAARISKGADYRDGVEPSSYFKAFLNALNFAVVLRDGSVLDVEVGPGIPLAEAFPHVTCPALSDAAYAAPVTVPYHSDTIKPETWHVLAKHVSGGTVVVAYSELEQGQSALNDNLAVFGGTVASAADINQGKLDNALSWAVITDSGALRAGGGRLPLKTDAMRLGEMLGAEQELERDGKIYLVTYLPLAAADGTRAGTVMQFTDVTLEHETLRRQLEFGAAVALASFVVFLLLAGYYAARHEGEKRAIREAFQNYFSPQIMDAILREPEKLKLGGQRREVTILFSDIRSFTSITEQLPPQELSRLLREYFDAMTEEVFATDGIVDKYIGDAIMAFWGAPIEQQDQADRAVRTAMGMIKRLRELQAKWRAEGLPALDAGIGINLGIATVGNLGSTRRFDYTLVGDAVNAASRIEQLNKEYSSHIIISETTKAQLTIPVPMRDLGEVNVRGKDKPIRIYEVEVSA